MAKSQHLILDLDLIKEGIFHRAYQLLHQDLNSALEHLSAKDLDTLKSNGLQYLDWKQLMRVAGDKSRVRFLSGYFTELLSRNETEINNGFVELVKMATHIDFKDEMTSLKFTRQLFELPWKKNRSTTMGEENLENARGVSKDLRVRV